ncbi:condensation domain-containing protein [Plantactinospora sp. WMMC1484]|uniref:condensation domain-containing protein n=1 Tax=Plantactinospora sp. WMMC1484 TaxID=3404122 RepID=UPI003BF5CEA6
MHRLSYHSSMQDLGSGSGTVSSWPLSYSEEKSWREFRADREVFFKRGSLLAVALDDTVDDRLLRHLVDTVTARHEILRTAYDTVNSGGSRHVLPSYEHEIRVVDKPLYPVDGLYENHVMPEDLVRVFLAPDPDGPGRKLYFDMNEMITDTGSTARLSTEVNQILGHEPGPLGPPPDVTYAQFAVEQRNEPLPHATLEFWKNTLDGMRAAGGIPDEGPDPSGDDAGERVLVLPDEGTAAFRAYCRRHRMSSFMAVGGLVNIALSAIWGIEDITLATAASTRPAKYNSVLGNFANNVLLRSRVTRSTTLAEAAEAGRTTVLQALRHPVQLLKVAETVGGLDVPPIRIHYLPNNAHYYKMLDSKPSGASWREPAEFPGWPLEVGFAEDSRKRVAIWMQYDPRRFHHARVEELMWCLRELLVVACVNGDESADAGWLADRMVGREHLD